MRVLITGGAGFIGSSLAKMISERLPEWSLTVVDDLSRPGAELNAERLREAGIETVRADVRDSAAFERIGPVDAIVDAAAEPSVTAEREAGGSRIVFGTNLIGAHHSLELAAEHSAHYIAISSSRVYPVERLREIHLEEAETRLVPSPEQDLPGFDPARGISEDFPLAGPRTLYGTTKLAAEMLAAEYSHNRGFPVTVNRCGVVSGPWQMGTSNQGVFAHWVVGHLLGKGLSYIGWGGSGKQVRDVLHVEDLAELLIEQLRDPEGWAGFTGNVGGGIEGSLSLLECTRLCQEMIGREVPIGTDPETRPGDVPWYASDCRRLHARTQWRPRRGPRVVIDDLITWAQSRTGELAAL